MIEIPEILRKREYRFIPITKEKRPIEIEWNTKNNYQFDSEFLLSKLREGYNYGILTGKGLWVLDFDDLEIYNKLKPYIETSLIVETGRGFHIYYKGDVLSQKFKDKEGNNIIEVFGISNINTPQYVVGPNSIHKTGKIYKILEEVEPLDQNLEMFMQKLPKEMVSSIFFNFCSVNKVEEKKNVYTGEFQSSYCNPSNRFDLKICKDKPIKIKTLAIVPNLSSEYKDRKIMFFEFDNKFHWRDLNKLSENVLKHKFGPNPYYWINQEVKIQSIANRKGQTNTLSLAVI